MDNGTLIVIGLIVAVAAALGLGFALFGFAVSLRDSNRKLRSGSGDEYASITPPTIPLVKEPFTKSILFGDVVDDHSSDVYVNVQPPVSSSEICIVCRQPVIDKDKFTCPDCGAQYHHDHFSFQNSCVNCGWRPS